MIKTVIRFQNDMVLVFDDKGRQVPEYQGEYQKVKKRILIDAPKDAVFAYGFTTRGELKKIAREEW